MDSAIQKLLLSQWRLEASSTKKALDFREVGFRVYSQHDEDGILLYILALVGARTRKIVEICCGNGRESNSANLICNHRWEGLLFDGAEKNVDEAKEFYANHRDTCFWPPTLVKAWITRGNINKLIEDNGFSGEVDILSIDLDGNDLWIWEAISVIQPRILVAEINHLWGATCSVSTPYADDFVTELTQYGVDYGGASLKAFQKVSRAKGYRLIGTNSISTNAFFMRNDTGTDFFPEIEAEACFDNPRARFGYSVRRLGIENKKWVEI